MQLQGYSTDTVLRGYLFDLGGIRFHATEYFTMTSFSSPLKIVRSSNICFINFLSVLIAMLGIALSYSSFVVNGLVVFPKIDVRSAESHASSDFGDHRLFSKLGLSTSPVLVDYFHMRNGRDHRVISLRLTRRSLISTITAFGFFVKPTYAIFDQKNTRIQLELCLVTILRVKYWAEKLQKSLQVALAENNSIRKKELYLESRAGAKALLTGRIGGGGGNIMVYTLANFRLRECLKDAIFWFKNNKQQQPTGTYKQQLRLLIEASEEIIYALGALVEFDGLDNTSDESPRSSLTLSMYNDDKGIFVQRMIREKLIPACTSFLFQFNNELFHDSLTSSQEFVKSNYPFEIPS